MGTTSRAERRERHLRAAGRKALLGLTVFLVVWAVGAARAEAADDAIPTAWHEAAGLTPLLTAPPPPDPATICVIDTGVTPTPDLDITARWAYDGGTLDDVRATPDSAGHGTSVAHFAAGAVNGWGHAGAFPHGKIASVRVFPREGGASWREYIAAIARCHKLDPNTKVIVISIGGQHIAPDEADELEHWIERARDDFDKNVVVAAGNSGGAPDFPARFPSAFAVAASSGDGSLCAFTARGSGVDIAAPGCDLAQSGWDGSAWTMNGTSYAAPIVAGVLAALRSYVPALNARDAEALLLKAARPAEVPVLDVRAAFATAGVTFDEPDISGGIEAAAPGSTPRVVSPHPPAAATATPGVLASARPLPRPRAVARRVGRRHVHLRILNRPADARTVIAIGRRKVVTGRLDLRLLAPTRVRVRIRFVRDEQTTPWTPVRGPYR